MAFLGTRVPRVSPFPPGCSPHPGALGPSEHKDGSMRYAGCPFIPPPRMPVTATVRSFPLLAPQTEDLARMYRLFQRIPKGLDPVAEIFKEHVDSEGMKLVKEVRAWGWAGMGRRPPGVGVG